MKVSLVRELRTRSHDQQRRPAFSSPSLRISVVMLILTVLVGIPSTPRWSVCHIWRHCGSRYRSFWSGRSNASVTLKSQENGSTQAQPTNSRGGYRFSLLLPGRYTVSVAVAGFQEANATAVVTIGQAATVNLSLALSEATSTVEVTSDAPLLQTENSDVSNQFY